MAAGCLLVFGLACRPSSPALPAPEGVRLEGAGLTGRLFRPGGEGAPAVAIFPGPGEVAEDWGIVAEEFRAAGYLVLVLEGLEGGAEWRERLDTLEEIQGVLLRAGADGENLFVLGADFGGTLALHVTRATPALQGVVMISPGLEYRGLEAEETLRGLVDRPVLLVCAEQDAYSAASSRALQASAPVFSELRTYAGSAHGVDLLLGSPNAVDQILQWLETVNTTANQGEKR